MLTIVPAKTSFCPGEEIQGKLTWSELTADRIEVRLIWFTRGKGTQDSLIVDSLEWDKVNRQGEFDYRFIAPRRPYSFSGKLISLIWAIEVIVFPDRVAEQQEIVITPVREEIDLQSVVSDDLKKN